MLNAHRLSIHLFAVLSLEKRSVTLVSTIHHPSSLSHLLIHLSTHIIIAQC